MIKITEDNDFWIKSSAKNTNELITDQLVPKSKLLLRKVFSHCVRNINLIQT